MNEVSRQMFARAEKLEAQAKRLRKRATEIQRRHKQRQIDEIEHGAYVDQLITIELINDIRLSGRDVAAIFAPQLEEQYEMLVGGDAEG